MKTITGLFQEDFFRTVHEEMKNRFSTIERLEDYEGIATLHMYLFSVKPLFVNYQTRAQSGFFKGIDKKLVEDDIVSEENLRSVFDYENYSRLVFLFDDGRAKVGLNIYEPDFDFTRLQD